MMGRCSGNRGAVPQREGDLKETTNGLGLPPRRWGAAEGVPLLDEQDSFSVVPFHHKPQTPGTQRGSMAGSEA